MVLPQSAYLEAGTTITVKCDVTEIGNPPLKNFTWLLSGVKPNVTSLPILKITSDDVGHVDVACYADNGVVKSKMSTISRIIFQG